MRLPLMLLLLPVLLLAACGDDEGSSGGGSGDEAAIEKVLQGALTSKDPKVVCAGSLSTDLIKRVYGDEQKCISVETENAKDDDQADGVEVSDITIDGEKATATVALSGGSTDGAKGPLDLVKQGEDWRVNDLSADLLRSQLEGGVTEDENLSKATVDCLKQKLLDLDDAELRKIAYGAIGEQEAAQQQLVELVTTCDPGLIRRQIEAGVTESLEQQGASKEQIACVKKELRERISDEQLEEAIGAGGNTDALEQSAGQAAAACKAGGSS